MQIMRLIFLLLLFSLNVFSQSLYFPKKIWIEKIPNTQGLNNEKINEAIKFALDNENSVE